MPFEPLRSLGARWRHRLGWRGPSGGKIGRIAPRVL